MAREMSLAVVGVEHPNKDGGNRRFEILLCEPGDAVELIPEPKNKADPNAVAVYSSRGVQIGYVTAERAPLIRGYLNSGRDVIAIFQDIARWGATIRLALDGDRPTLPLSKASDGGEAVALDQDFWPDEIPPDD